MSDPIGTGAIRPASGLPGGAIDVPATGTVVPRAALHVAGWAATVAGPCSRVELTLDNRPLGRGRLGRYRPDVAQATGRPVTAFSGFDLLVDLSVTTSHGSSVTLGGWGVGLDGQVFELPAVALELADETPPHRHDRSVTSRSRLPGVRRHTGSDATRMLICSHDLRYGGAPVVLTELIRTIRERHEITGDVLSFGDGPLRGMFERLDLDLHIWPQLIADCSATYESRIAGLCEWLATRQYDVALVNTVVAFPAADACLRLGIPTAWAIHESCPVPLIAPTYRIHPGIVATLEQTLRDATRLCFVSEATRRLYQQYLPETPCVTLGY